MISKSRNNEKEMEFHTLSLNTFEDFLIVLDYDTAKVYVYKIDSSLSDSEIVNTIIKKGHSINNCNWMVSPKDDFEIVYD